MPSKLLLYAAAGLCLLAADRYDGPRPPKPDVPYLLHANHLVPTEVSEAQEQGGKKESSYVIPGAASPAKTPMAEPIFIIESSKLTPEQIELYRLEVKGGSRQVVLTQRRRRSDSGPFHMLVTRLGDRLYKIEAD